MEQLTKYSSFTSQWASNLAIKLSFFSLFNVAFSHWVLSPGVRAFVAENVPTTQTSGPTGEELSFLDSSGLLSKPSLPLARWLVGSLSRVPVTEGWCLPKENLSGLIAIQLMRCLELLSALIFSSLPLTSLDVFLNNWCILSVPAAPAGRWHCHMVSSSTCEPRVCFSRDVLDRSRCKVSVLSSVQGWSCPVVASDKAAPQLPRTVVPYWGLCHSLKVAPDTLVCQWCPSTVSEQPLALS